MATHETLSTVRRVFSNLKAAKFTPWEVQAGNDGKTKEVLSDVTYDLVDIVADTTSVEQADNEINTIEHEFTSAPLFENVNLGEKTFTTECVDFQNAVLKELFGWHTTTDGDAFAPVGYADLYCKVELEFNSTKDILVLPKVKLNSRAVIASMKTDVSRANITGTCYPAYVAVSVGEENERKYKYTDMAVISSGNKSNYDVTSGKPTDGTEVV